jgi:hypothetical protein
LRTFSEIKADLLQRFTDLTNKEVRETSALGLMTAAFSKELGTAYQEIEDAKNPHIYTNLDTDGLNATGTFVNVTRQDDESDDSYLYRIMNWTYLKESSNETAINDSLLNLTYASNAQFVKNTKGAGTGTIYIIPLVYDDETQNNALTEVKDRIKNVLSPLSYIEYVIPTIRPVQLIIKIESSNGDLSYLKTAITSQIEDYINAIAPNDYMKLGKINSIGQNTNLVDYFVVTGLYVDGEVVTKTNVLQGIDTKLIFNEIVWED